jgi:hypothetical protein
MTIKAIAEYITSNLKWIGPDSPNENDRHVWYSGQIELLGFNLTRFLFEKTGKPWTVEEALNVLGLYESVHDTDFYIKELRSIIKKDKSK